eukprot:465934_1
MQQLIPIVNKLNDVFATVGAQPLDLPQVAVVGSQSSGKSSVLENIVGIDFLPRGNDIVTRRPLILQLFNTSHLHKNTNNNKKEDIQDNDQKIDYDNKPWGEFLHSGTKKWYDFNAIRQEIAKETDRIAPNKKISYEPINLKIYSPSVLNITLIDLPGITKVAIANQPPDIERRVKKLIRSFISRPKCLILAITPAISDIATSEAMQISKQVDPKSVRTLGVITKIDLMDKGTNALKILNGDIIPLKLGYVGVVNRSQLDIRNDKSRNDAIQSEKMFFKNHSAYRSIANVCGAQYLSHKLNKIFLNHIKRQLPDFKQDVNRNIKDLKQEILSYGCENVADQNKGALLLGLIGKFCENFNNIIAGRGTTKMKIMKKELMEKIISIGGSRILYLFDVELNQKLSRIKPFDGLSDAFILNTMRDSAGVSPALFIPEHCFEELVKIQIEKLRNPCLKCVDMVYEELKRIKTQSETVEITSFPKLSQSLNQCCDQLFQKNLASCIESVNQLIDFELAYIRTNHPDFVSMDDVFTNKVQQETQSKRAKRSPPLKTFNDSDKEKEKQILQPKTWICSRCTLENPMVNEKCTACDESKPQQFKTKAPSWIKTDNKINNTSNKSPQNTRKTPSSIKTDNKNDGWGGFWGSNNIKKKQQKDTNPFNNDNVSTAKHNNNNKPPINYQSQSQSHSIHQQKNERIKKRKTFNNEYASQNLPNATQKEQMELLVIKKFIGSYFAIVKKNMSDLVPKSIMCMLVNKSKQKLQQELALSLYKNDKIDELFVESPQIAQKRKTAKQLLEILQKAVILLNDVNNHKLDPIV